MNILKIFTKRRLTANTGESAAAKLLKKSGYKILEKNYVADGHEIDIIARNSEYTVFAEVKTRTEGKENPKEPRPASSVNRKKIESILSAAKVYIAFARPRGKIRFDVIEVYLDEGGLVTKTVHMPDAFRGDTYLKH